MISVTKKFFYIKVLFLTDVIDTIYNIELRLKFLQFIKEY